MGKWTSMFRLCPDWASTRLAGVALTTTALGVLLGWEDAVQGHAALLFLTLPVIVSAYLGGLGPGLLATAVGALGAHYLFIEPRFAFFPLAASELTRLILFWLTGAAISVVGESLRRTSRLTDEVADVARFPAENPSPVLRIDDRGRVLYANEPAKALLASLGGACGELAPVELREPTVASLADGSHRDFVIEWAAGCEVAFLCVPIAKQKSVNLYGCHVTRCRRADAMLRERESFFRQMLESIPGMVFTTRPDGYCDYQSRQWVDYTGVPMSEHVGDGWAMLLHPDDRARAYQAWRAAVEGIAPYDLEYRVRRYDGEYEWFKVIGRPICDSAGQIVRWFGVALNVENLKRVSDELGAAKESAEQAKATAELANRAKDHFLAVLSHELRTPLAPVVIGVSMLQDRTDLDAEVRETLEMVRRNVEMEARLIDDLLDVTRIARGKLELNRDRVELGTVIHRAVEVCQPEIDARDLHFAIDLGPAAPYWVDVDVPRLQQVFWNLLKNAVKFTPQGGCLGIRCRPNQHHVVVEVSDSGIGIEPGALSRVFNAFEQAERSITRQFGGLGLGLAISKALVEMHGGEIEAESEGRGKGSTFRIRLPVATPKDRSLAAPLSSGRPRLSETLRILLVEDHAATAKIMRRVLTHDGHHIETAGDVATALRLATEQTFDLLISDLGLPDGSGHELMRDLRAQGFDSPAIALSGYGQEEDIAASLHAGFAAHLTKPASREALASAIAGVVRGSRSTGCER